MLLGIPKGLDSGVCCLGEFWERLVSGVSYYMERVYLTVITFHPELRSFELDSGFFDMINEARNLYITDYSYLKPHDNHPLIVTEPSSDYFSLTEDEDEEDYIELCGNKWHQSITSIEDLTDTVAEIIDTILLIHRGMLKSEPPWVHPVNILLTPRDVDLLVEQVVFDLLFDKYIVESELMTRYQYATRISKRLSPVLKEPLEPKNIDAQLSRFMDRYIEKMSKPAYRKQLEMLGIDPNAHNDYFNPDLKNNPNAQKPKFFWDLFFYNSGQNNITARIYRRELTQESHNYPYKDFIDDLNKYANMIDALLPAEDAEPKKYFVWSMDYYMLESYKRLDFIFKLISKLPKMGETKINKDHFLIKRYHPLVMLPYLSGGYIEFTTKYKYYRPMFKLENAIAAEIRGDDEFIEATYRDRLRSCQFVRAKAYELFKYHYKYESSDYADIKEFLQQSYNLEVYHSSTRQWADFKKADWEMLDISTKRKLKKQMKSIINIVEALFGKHDENGEKNRIYK